MVNINPDGDYSCQGVNLAYSGWLESDMSEEDNILIRGKINDACAMK